MKQLLLFLTLINTSFGLSQSNELQTYKHRAYLEIAGHGGMASVNYETKIKKYQRPKSQFTFRTGVSFMPGDKNSGSSLVFPNSCYFLLGEKHFLELGIGEVLRLNLKGFLSLRAIPSIGYRFMSALKSLFFRAIYTPFVSHYWDVRLSHWAGISIGYQFK